MTRFLFSWILGFVFSLGYTTYFHYQMTSLSLGGMQALGVAALVLVYTGGNFYLSFWNLAGFTEKPELWQYYEEKGIPYTLKRNNINILGFFGFSFGIFTLTSLGLDLILGQNLSTTIQGVFYGKEEMVKAAGQYFYWKSSLWPLFAALYGGTLGGFITIGLQYWQRKDQEEVHTAETPVKEEDK